MGIVFRNHLLLQIGSNLILRRLYPDSQDLLILPPVQGKHPVSRNRRNFLRKMIVGLVYRLLLFIPGLRGNQPLLRSQSPDIHPIFRHIGNLFSNNVKRSGHRFLFRRHSLFF